MVTLPFSGGDGQIRSHDCNPCTSFGQLRIVRKAFGSGVAAFWGERPPEAEEWRKKSKVKNKKWEMERIGTGKVRRFLSSLRSSCFCVRCIFSCLMCTPRAFHCINFLSCLFVGGSMGGRPILAEQWSRCRWSGSKCVDRRSERSAALGPLRSAPCFVCVPCGARASSPASPHTLCVERGQAGAESRACKPAPALIHPIDAAPTVWLGGGGPCQAASPDPSTAFLLCWSGNRQAQASACSSGRAPSTVSPYPMSRLSYTSTHPTHPRSFPPPPSNQP